MTAIYLDIETIPSQSPDLLAKLRADVKPPGNIKKPESIAAWMEENADSAAAEAMEKTSFDPGYGHICTIAWAGEDDRFEPDCAHARTVEQEADVIRAFFDSLPRDTYGAPMFVGHYIGGFDLRFILCRAVILGIPIPPQIPRDPKPWDKSMFDTMTAWAGARGTISMDRLCEALGLPSKGDFDGSMVAEAWATGEHETIIEYCKRDVEAVRAIHRRFVAVNW
jgi:DNA polymerase elongation subunit (family B)